MLIKKFHYVHQRRPYVVLSSAISRWPSFARSQWLARILWFLSPRLPPRRSSTPIPTPIQRFHPALKERFCPPIKCFRQLNDISAFIFNTPSNVINNALPQFNTSLQLPTMLLHPSVLLPPNPIPLPPSFPLLAHACHRMSELICHFLRVTPVSPTKFGVFRNRNLAAEGSDARRERQCWVIMTEVGHVVVRTRNVVRQIQLLNEWWRSSSSSRNWGPGKSHSESLVVHSAD